MSLASRSERASRSSLVTTRVSPDRRNTRHTRGSQSPTTTRRNPSPNRQGPRRFTSGNLPPPQPLEPVALLSWTENRPQDMGLTDQRFCTCCGRPPRISHSATGSLAPTTVPLLVRPRYAQHQARSEIPQRWVRRRALQHSRRHALASDEDGFVENTPTDSLRRGKSRCTARNNMPAHPNKRPSKTLTRDAEPQQAGPHGCTA